MNRSKCLPDVVRVDGKSMIVNYVNIGFELTKAVYLYKHESNRQPGRLLLTYLRLRYLFMDDAGNFPPDYHKIAKLLNCSQSTLRAHLSALVGMGWVRRLKKKHYQFVSMYRLRDRPCKRAKVLRVNTDFLTTCSLQDFRAMVMEAVIDNRLNQVEFHKWREENKDLRKDDNGRWVERDGVAVSGKYKPKKVSQKLARNLSLSCAASLCSRSAPTISRYRDLNLFGNYQTPKWERVKLSATAIKSPRAYVDYQNSHCREGFYVCFGSKVYFLGVTKRTPCFSPTQSISGCRYKLAQNSIYVPADSYLANLSPLSN